MFKSVKKLIIVFVVLIGITVALGFVSAGGVDVGMEYGEKIGLASTDPRIIAARIVQIFLGFLGIIAVGLIIFAGFIWMTSGGDESKVDKAKQILKNALIGLIIILSAFAIATFVLNKLLIATGSGGGGGGSGGGGGGGGGIGVLGACAVESVYPEPNQKEVPRNTRIIITFKEEINPSSICAVNAGDNCNGENILLDADPAKQSIRIYKTNDGESNFLTTVKVYGTTDKKTFVLDPGILGSPSEYIWYTAYFSNDILTAGNKGVFDSCRSDFMEWQFEVSNKLDLTPPQIASVFPSPDNQRDEIIKSSEATKASGEIIVRSVPRVYSPAKVSGAVRRTGDSLPASAEADARCRQTGIFTITVSSDETTATLSHGGASLGASVFSGSKVVFNGFLTLIINDNGKPSAGNSWEIDIEGEKQADTISIGRDVYSFSNEASSPTQIKVESDTAQTAVKIVSFINDTRKDVSARNEGNRVIITAVNAGQAGNIVLSSSRKDVLDFSGLSGGADQKVNIKINDKKDQPMNSVIQINFDEAVLPLTVSGPAESVKDYIRVVDLGNNQQEFLPGTFIISNKYRTVEFISDNQCGVNGCGDPIYCLPPLSNLKVEIMAASLAVCASNNDCASKSPYTNCNGNCQDDDGKNYPTSNLFPMNGIMDVAFNSLDGNRNDYAEGPKTFYNENVENSLGGDNFVWFFFISDQMETDPPIIEKTSTGIEGKSNLISPLEINFNKLLMAGSLRTGQVRVEGDNGEVIHKALNIWSLTGRPLGYWVAKEDLISPDTGEPHKTKVIINHTPFAESVSYRAQAGSAIRDIYQNCFKPSADLGVCAGVSENEPSCCNGTPVGNLGADGNCP